MHCLQAKPYKYTCYSCQAAVTSELANRLLHVLGKDYFMLHKILCGFITAHFIVIKITVFYYRDNHTFLNTILYITQRTKRLHVEQL